MRASAILVTVRRSEIREAPVVEGSAVVVWFGADGFEVLDIAEEGGGEVVIAVQTGATVVVLVLGPVLERRIGGG